MLKSCYKCYTYDEADDDATECIRFFEVQKEVNPSTGYSISVQPLAVADRFVIDFYLDNKDKDIALRLEISFSTSSVTRNSRIEGEWGIEERYVPQNFHLVDVKNFEILVFFKVDGMAIAFDNKHIADYEYRQAFDHIHSIVVSGAFHDVFVQSKPIVCFPKQRVHIPYIARRHIETFEMENLQSEAVGGNLSGGEITFLALPHYVPLKSCFGELRRLSVIGKVNHRPKAIKFALQKGYRTVPLPAVALHLEVRFTEKRAAGTDEPIIAFNSFAAGKWQGEMKCKLENGLQPGGDFSLLVKYDEDSFKIYMNEKHIYNYQYVIDPKLMDTCYVDGDIKLISVAN